MFCQVERQQLWSRVMYSDRPLYFLKNPCCPQQSGRVFPLPGAEECKFHSSMQCRKRRVPVKSPDEGLAVRN